MADINSDIYQTAGDFPRKTTNPARKGGRVRVASALMAVVGADVDINDKAFVVRLPSTARLLPEGTVYFDALGAGAADVDFGDANAPDALGNAINMTSAGSAGALSAVGIEKYGQRLWEMLGYASDPRSDLSLFFTFKGEPAADGDIFADLRWVND